MDASGCVTLTIAYLNRFAVVRRRLITLANQRTLRRLARPLDPSVDAVAFKV